MKVTKKNKDSAVKLAEPAIAIGNRGTATILAKTLPAGVVFGENQQLPKIGKDEQTAPWLIVRSWISSRPHPFTVQPVGTAIRKGLVKLIKGAVLTHKGSGKKYTADLLVHSEWKPGQKWPQNVAVINTKWPGGRIESKLVSEAPRKDGSKPPARNAAYVGTIEIPPAKKASK